MKTGHPKALRECRSPDDTHDVRREGPAAAVERNMVVVKRSAYATTPLQDGDAIEVVNFVGGG